MLSSVPPMKLTTYRDGRMAPAFAVWNLNGRVVLNLWVAGWSVSLSNGGR